MRKISSLASAEVAVDRLTTQTDYDNIVKVKDKLPEITSVADNIAQVVNVESMATEIASLHSDKATLDSLYADKATLDSIFADKTALDSIFADKAKLDSLINDKATLDSLYADKATLDGLYTRKAAIDSLFADKAALDSLYADKATLDSLYADKAKLDSLYTDKTALDNIYAKLTEIDAVGADILKGKGTNQPTDSAVLNALDNATTATTKASEASNSAYAAYISEVNAKASETNSSTSETNAAASEAAAANSEANAAIYETNAANSEANAAIYETNAANSEANAAIYETNAANSATISTDKAAIATTQANNASTSASNAVTSENNAKSSENNAATSEVNAHDWSEYTVDMPVPSGNGSEYSAKHWASKAAAAATGSLKYMGSWDASTPFPINSQLGDYYKVSVPGPESSAPYTYNSGDAIIYNGNGWDLIDSSDAVSSVDGQIGAVNLSNVYEPKNANIQGHITSTTNPHSVTKAQVGLGNVDDTADIDKPVSTAQDARFTAVEAIANAALPASSYTESDVLAKIKTVDGSGSGLDADTVDGLDSTQFLRSDVNDTMNADLTVNNLITAGTVDGRDVAADGAKLDGIEAGATADQTAAEIKTAYENNANTNAYTDAEKAQVAVTETTTQLDARDVANRLAAQTLHDSGNLDCGSIV